MTLRFARILVIAGLLLALAVPATASAHRGRDGDHGVCRAVQNNRVPRNLTAAQAQAIASACTTRAAAIRAAATAFDAATQPAFDAYRATVNPLVAQLRTAAQARRTACRADRTSQACADARAAFRTTARTVAPQIRAARRTLRTAIAPAVQTYRAAVRAAQQAFRTAVDQALGRS